MLFADKNIGPCAANRSECISKMIKQRFGNENVCERISKGQAQQFMEEAIKKSSNLSPTFQKIKIRRE